MFSPGGDDRKMSNARMLGEMIALLGPPTREFLQRADETLAYWNHEGKYLSPCFPTFIDSVTN
jgi:serine/threonine-protein kinase SRPK3